MPRSNLPKFVAARSKYRAIPTVYKGVRYPSKSEASWAEYLDQEKALGIFEAVIGQPRFHVGPDAEVINPDFLLIMKPEALKDAVFKKIFEATGLMHFVDEVKGMETPTYKKKKKDWAKYGPCAYRVIKRGKVVEVLIPEPFDYVGADEEI